jgi:hypothetical protein
MIRVLDFPASGTGQVASKKGFKHQDEGVPLHPFEFLSDYIAGNPVHLRNRYGHSKLRDSV